MKRKALTISMISVLSAGVVATAIAVPLVLLKKNPVTPEPVPPTPTPSKDKETVTKLNNLLVAAEEEGLTFNTMSALIAYLSLNEVDLETLVASDSDQYVWDSEKNVIFTMNTSGAVSCAPDGYTLNSDTSKIWKMVNLPISSKLFSTTNGTTENFDANSVYGQYLKSGQEYTTTEQTPLVFSCNIDTGSNENLYLKYSKTEGTTVSTPKVVTYCSNLFIEGSVSDIEHYGHAKSITVTNIKDGATFKEYGTVDGNVTLYDGNFEAKPDCSINTILIESNDVGTVKIEQEGTGEEAIPAVVGTIATTTEGVTVTSKVDDEEVTVTEAKPDVKAEKQEKTQIYDCGFGTVNSPYIISTPEALKKCATDVNTGSADKVWGFKLAKDIELDANEEWTPIGKSKDLPFRGVFDGNGYTVSNLTMNISVATNGTEYGFGLFGWTGITAQPNTEYNTTSDVWSDNELSTDKITSDKYETNIKNVTLENVNITSTGKAYCVGSLIGSAVNTHIFNDHVLNGNISGYKHVGGLAGTMLGSICSTCSVGSDDQTKSVNVESSTYSAGGLLGSNDYMCSSLGIGYTCCAYILCSTYSNVCVKASDLTAAAVAGIMGYNCGSKALVFDNCINNATIEATNTTASSSASSQSIAGITGFGESVGVIANCVNNGDLKTSSGSFVNNVAGIVNKPNDNLIFNCENKHDITVNAKMSLAGIAGNVATDITSAGLRINSCSNSGTLTNTCDAPLYKTADIASGICALVFDNQTFENVDAISKAIESSVSTGVKIIFNNCTVNDQTGTLKLPTNVFNIVSNTPLCSNIDVTESTTDLNVKIPNSKITVTKVTNCEITSEGENSTIEIAANAQVKKAIVTGSNSQVINKGTVTRTIGIDGASTYGENYGTCANVTFGKTSVSTCDKTFLNKGTITGAEDSSDTNNNSTIFAKGDATNAEPKNHYITFDNYGTIQYKATTSTENEGFFRMDALCMHITLNCYNDSKLIKDSVNGWFTIFNNSDSIKLRHQSNAKAYEATNPLEFADLAAKSQYVTEEEF